MKVYCGIDIGGTRVRIILIDSSKQILAKDQFSTLSGSGPTIFMEKLTATIQKILPRSGSDFELQSIESVVLDLWMKYRGHFKSLYTGWFGGFGLTEAINAVSRCQFILK
jgi:N-acetylglucosamine kinase-like BadF-type ATPase